ncbi:MAG: inosine/xanthosine triphosphatase [Algoriphagus sp.]|jgi:inosine/xanthosine triphosphatase|uniref:inosine/xanthosine triphosphatase n=1 Tax=Algoriphagus sp. TaxID=1872435 RepID=UPI00271CDA6A|nr:inosine/xanthosine triphosphatase [Algoriphagus sp.]MDO8967693.1 inosine/xanthosine triphosphatase [Algoriphagus sp.]MDP2041938.1 inosine/xanthosine triphosphatase [Algoriphagus sp.]MDP3199977.1 inosine/xanthosine triphosphatase [Algoriphagus sp.]MDP3474125.1 inosine/xanthosine triphosphatase [Algoriphagus sp.]
MNFKRRQNFQPSDKLLVLVGSKNPVKISCTEDAFTRAFNKSFLVEGINAASGVSDQPMGDQETLQGAINRAKNSRDVFPEAHYWVGIEGGLDEDEAGMFAFAWIFILDTTGKTSQSKTGTFYLPAAVSKLVKEGMELGMADDTVFNQENSKQQGGSVGILTHGIVDRNEYYRQAIILALIPFLNENLF